MNPSHTIGGMLTAITLPPSAFLVLGSGALIPAALHNRYWELWAAGGFLAGLIGAGVLAVKVSRWWALLAVPAIADGWVAWQMMVAVMVRTH
jgi:hypothetical protein